MQIKRLITLIFIAFLIHVPGVGISQTLVKGRITDKLDKNVSVTNGSVYLLNSLDSLLLDYNFVQRDGSFYLSYDQDINKDVILVINAKNYLDQWIPIDSNNTDIQIGLFKKSILIEEIRVTGRLPILVKGDTIEYSPDISKLDKNAKVEELLKILPGLTVSSSGSITANGKVVDKVLLDGEEFFGDDYTLLTRNIRSDMVQKVQLFDTKSDFEKLSKIKDSSKDTKTINVQLKEDKKEGYFGEIKAMGGNDKIYESEIKLNIFKDRQKLSVFGLASSIGLTSLSRSDQGKYGFSNSRSAVIVLNASKSNELNMDSYSGIGSPSSVSFGGHFSGSNSSKRTSVNTNFIYSKFDLDVNRRINDSYTSPQMSFFRETTHNVSSSNRRHILETQVTQEIDSTARLKFTLNYQHQKRTSNKDELATLKIDDNSSKISNYVDNRNRETNFSLSGLLTKKIRNTQSFSSQVNFNVLDISSTSRVTSVMEHIPLDKLDQEKVNFHSGNLFEWNNIYTNRISKRISAVITYGFLLNNNTSEINSYNVKSGDENLLDSLTSGNFKVAQLMHTIAGSLDYRFSKSTVNFNNTLLISDTEVNEKFYDQKLIDRFINYNPQLTYNIDLSNKLSLNFKYAGTTIQPSVLDRMGYYNNMDPLNVYVGNPNIRSSFNNKFSGTLNYFSPMKNTFLGIGISQQSKYNPVVSDLTTGIDGTNIYTSSNGIRPMKSIDLNLIFGSDVTPKLRAGSNLSISKSNFFNKINGFLNKVEVSKFSPEVNVTYTDQNLMKVYVSFNPFLENFRNNTSNYKKENLLSLKTYFEFNLYKIKNVGVLKLDGWHDVRFTDDAYFKSYTQNLLNVSIYRDFLQSKTLRLGMGIYNLLDNKTIYSRSLSQNFLNQIYSNTIPRYFNLSVKLDVSKI